MRWTVPSVSVRLWPIALLVALALFALGTSASAQRAEESGWSQPLNLSNSLSSSSTAAIAADRYGSLHVFWSEDLDGGPLPLGQNAVPGNGILYRSYHDGAWSKTSDIFYAGSIGRAWKPSAVADAQGFINLVWSENDTLMYSRAPIALASRPQGWSAPVMLDPGPIFEVELLENDGYLTAIYDVDGGDGRGVYGMDIQNGQPGNPVLIWPSPLGFKPQKLSAAMDGKGRVHVVWEVVPAGDWQVIEVRYAASGVGKVWSNSRVVARTTSPETSVALAGPWVAAVGQDEIHLEWAQGALTNRWHEYSTDGGHSWSEPVELWSDLVSQTGSKAVGAASNGDLYWTDVFRYPNGAYFTRWDGEKWETPTLFYLMQRDAFDPLGDRINVHAMRMAVSRGNELDIVFQDNSLGEIYFMKKQLPLDPMPTAELAAVEPTPTATPTSTPHSIAAPVRPTRKVPVHPVVSNQPVQSPPDTLSMILLSSGAALLVVTAIVIAKRWTAIT